VLKCQTIENCFFRLVTSAQVLRFVTYGGKKFSIAQNVVG
jgi:hypothetical protein